MCCCTYVRMVAACGERNKRKRSPSSRESVFFLFHPFGCVHVCVNCSGLFLCIYVLAPSAPIPHVCGPADTCLTAATPGLSLSQPRLLHTFRCSPSPKSSSTTPRLSAPRQPPTPALSRRKRSRRGREAFPAAAEEAAVRSGVAAVEAVACSTAVPQQRRQRGGACFGRGGSPPGASVPHRRSWGARSSTRMAELLGRRGPSCW